MLRNGIGQDLFLRVCERSRDAAFARLYERISPERRISEMPDVMLTSEPGEGGSCKRLDKFVKVNDRLNIQDARDVISHESLHFWQFRDAFYTRVLAFKERINTGYYGNVVAEMLPFAILEAGAYFFERLVQEDDGSGSTAKNMIAFLCDGFHPEGGYRVARAVYEGIRGNDLELIVEVGLFSGSSKDIDEVRENAIANLGKSLALLALAANGYDVDRTFECLVSDPEELIGKISAMREARVDGLEGQMRGIGESMGVCVGFLRVQKGKEAAPEAAGMLRAV